MQTNGLRVWGIVGYALRLIAIMILMFLAGTEYASNRKYALSVLILPCLGIADMVRSHVRMLQNQKPF